ncbi:cob(I)yrinic acid a,c-diamide adenosyltransferase [bacterium]|nr:cob(I)yrinic acid a,c-diamide adenosyltransferase [candidate division CSSED10-310 bacterium]
MNREEFPWFTGKGDSGLTSLLGGQRVPKDHPRPESYGAVDEVSSILGFVRALTENTKVKEVIIQIQRDLYHIMSELAATPEIVSKYRKIADENIKWLEHIISQFGCGVKMQGEFVLPGNSVCGSLWDVTRTVVRRAERIVIRLYRQEPDADSRIVSYLNRLSSVCFTMARFEDSQSDTPVIFAKHMKKP